MKKNILIVLSGVLFFACDRVEDPVQKKDGAFDEELCAEQTFDPNTNTKRNVLIEDFTGHTCTGCPGAAYIVEQMEQTYGEQVIGIAMHAGFFAEPYPAGTIKFETDFRSEFGSALHNDFGPINSYPKGMINRSDTVLNNGSRLFGKDEFESAFLRFKDQAPAANLQIKHTYDDNDRTLCVSVETEALQQLSGEYNVVIAITEDSIVDWQKNGTAGSGSPNYSPGDVQNYVHNHVLRNNVNGMYGERIISGNLSATEKIVSNYTSTLDANWNDEHLNIVAYLMNWSTKEVIQVVKVHM